MKIRSNLKSIDSKFLKRTYKLLLTVFLLVLLASCHRDICPGFCYSHLGFLKFLF